MNNTLEPHPTERTVAYRISEFLQKQGVEMIFGIPGRAVLSFLDAFEELGIRFVLTRHEQGAIHAADGYARSTGKVGVCFATSGPGASNLITGLATACRDSSPVLALVGNVPSHRIGTNAFQEFDAVTVAKTITGFSGRVGHHNEWQPVLTQAWECVIQNPKKPALIEVPADVARAKGESGDNNGHVSDYAQDIQASESCDLDTVVSCLKKAERPIIIAGGACRMPQVRRIVSAFAEQYKIPVISTMNSLSKAWKTPYWLGLYGIWGTEMANFALWQSDCVLALGVRFVQQHSRVFPPFQADNPYSVIQIDWSEETLRRTAGVPPLHKTQIRAEVAHTVSEIQTRITQPKTSWYAWSESFQAGYEAQEAHHATTPLPIQIIRTLGQSLPSGSIVCSDIGQHLLWAARHLFFPGPGPDMFLTAAGFGTMGFGLPAAIGALFGNPNKEVWLITGDGSLMMTITEMDTLLRFNLPLRILLLDNQALGLIYQDQRFQHTARIGTTYPQRETPFVNIAQAFGLQSYDVHDNEAFAHLLGAHKEVRQPVLYHILTEKDNRVLPIFGPSKKDSYYG